MNTCQITASKEKCRQKSKSKSYTILWCLQGNVLWRLVVFVRKFTYLEWTKKKHKNDQIKSDLIKKPKDVKWKDLSMFSTIIQHAFVFKTKLFLFFILSNRGNPENLKLNNVCGWLYRCVAYLLFMIGNKMNAHETCLLWWNSILRF